jgi:hypothetical protein
MTVEATATSGATVNFSTSASDLVSGAVTTNSNPASGSVFPLGTTTVTTTATDAAGNAASRTFTVTVRDTTAPVITVPSNMTVEATSASGATVNFSTSASDLVSGAVTTNSNPASGSVFPLGTTTVTTTASDAAGNAASRTFTVTVNFLNVAPVLSAIGNKTVIQGGSLTFTASATDANLPAQTLVYSLDAGAPSGAVIHSSTGGFTWAPSDTQGAGAYSVTVRVTDSGSPALSISETIVVTVTNGLPAPWLSQDIGSTGAVGSSIYTNGTHQVVGAGANIYGSSDTFRFTYQLASGDCEIMARIASIGSTSPYAKAGVMIRESLTGNAKNAFAMVMFGGGSRFQYRKTAGGTTSLLTGGATDVAPYWVKMTRSGDVFRAYRSGNGVTWTQMGTDQTITMGANVYVGFGVTSYVSGTLNTSTFTNASVTP